MHKALQIVATVNRFLGTKFTRYGGRSPSSLEAGTAPVRARLLAQWQDSDRTDFSVYHDREYVLEAVHCYEKTKLCTAGVHQYFAGCTDARYVIEPYTGGPASALSCIDVWNGIGLTTIDLAQVFGTVEAVNSCDVQVEFMDLMCETYGMSKIRAHEEIPFKMYDVVVSLECLEHYQEPLLHLEQLLEITRGGGYFVESSGFNSGLNDIGHYTSYTVNGKTGVSPKSAKRACTEILKQRATLVYNGFNRCPKIWRLK